jgi:hypothetical protein
VERVGAEDLQIGGDGAAVVSAELGEPAAPVRRLQAAVAVAGGPDEPAAGAARKSEARTVVCRHSRFESRI